MFISSDFWSLKLTSRLILHNFKAHAVAVVQYFAATVAIILVFKYHQMRANMLQKATYAKERFFIDGLASK